MNFDNLDFGQLWCFIIDFVVVMVEKQLMVSCCCEFFVVYFQQVGCLYCYVYMGVVYYSIGNVFFQVIFKVDLEFGIEILCFFVFYGFVGEFIFVF